MAQFWLDNTYFWNSINFCNWRVNFYDLLHESKWNKYLLHPAWSRNTFWEEDHSSFLEAKYLRSYILFWWLMDQRHHQNELYILQVDLDGNAFLRQHVWQVRWHQLSLARWCQPFFHFHTSRLHTRSRISTKYDLRCPMFVQPEE